MTNPLAEALQARRFCYVVELVASGLTREARLLEVASRLAALPEVVAGSITSYAGGAMGHDPIRVGTAARARGLTPNIHVTCVGEDREGLGKTLADLHALGIENVFALTGDYPKAGTGVAAPVFDLDSVQLVSLISDLRRRGMPFHVAVAVSPFKYVEADCVYQYLKLEKKIAAGADLAITQVGWDAWKFAELTRYLSERGLTIPVLGNVYVLGPKAAERMATGQPPGCWLSPALLETVRAESSAKDGGLQARLERAARTVAVLRGLGYAGAYIGGTNDASHVSRIIRRSEELAPRWEELSEELRYGDPDGFYLHGRPSTSHVAFAASAGDRSASSASTASDRSPARRGGTTLVPRALDLLGRLLPVTRDTWLCRIMRTLMAWVDRRPTLAAALERVELAVKQPMFGCQACGNCVLGHMEYVCPQTCPKQMRNGPCGGTLLGRCEVVDQPCIWVDVYQRAKAADRITDLKVYVPPPDRSLRGTSSWINYFLERDSRPRP
ncbi:MAG TPA: methylenetetrahydrofolate reductase C-terminal domain-containing protein [Candidatus Methylomirabilis sp.]|nr:methylenetetrahydrofolate reductase C-terminal domain-containing protein [Candidatus Methylomirabilis sp.]